MAAPFRTRALAPHFARHAELDAEPDRLRRAALVQEVRAIGPIADERVLSAMLVVPRHLFVPPVLRAVAYEDRPLHIGWEQTISQPTIVAVMTEALETQRHHRVLEIGTGSGYQAAVLAMLVNEVYSIERIAPLGDAAKERLARLGYRNVHVRVGDGYAGWPQHAPFDRIVVTAAPPGIPGALVDQLRDGGVLVAPIGLEDGDQRLVRIRRHGSTVRQEDLGPVRFVPMVAEDLETTRPDLAWS